MNWDVIRPGLLALIQSLTEIGATSVLWEDQPRTYTDPTVRAQLLLSLKNVRGQGYGDFLTTGDYFLSSVVSSVFIGLPDEQQIANQVLYFCENPPAPFITNTPYYVVSLSGSTFSLSATSGGSAIVPTPILWVNTVLSWQIPGQELQDVLSGILLFDVLLKCESYEQEDGKTAYQYLEEIRQRIHRKTSTDAMLAINCAFYDESPTQDTSAPQDNRMVSKAELSLNTRTNFSEADGNRYGYIATVTTTGP